MRWAHGRTGSGRVSAKPTQRARVLAFLRDAGARGIHTHELRAAFIGNPSQRITELEDAGHEIVHKRPQPPADHDQLVGFDAAIEVGGTHCRPRSKGPYSDVYEDAA